MTSDEQRTKEPKSALNSNRFFFPIADLLFVGDGASDISKCFFVGPALLVRFAQGARGAFRGAITALGEFGFHSNRCLFGQLRDMLVFVFFNKNSQHVHERSKRMVFVFADFIGNTVE